MTKTKELVGEDAAPNLLIPSKSSGLNLNKEAPSISKMENNKSYNLEERTLVFAQDVRDFIKRVPQNIYNTEYSKQLIRSSASVGANYIEANEALGKKDLKHRVKISRKEAKESKYWLELIEAENKTKYINEAVELTKIFSAIIRKLV